MDNASLTGLKILLVDDDQESPLLFSEVLSHEGAIICTANTGMEALSLIEIMAFDVLLADIAMPGMSGFELIRRLRAKGWSGTAITVSAYARIEDIQESLESGFDDHLSKPVNIFQLVERIAALCEHTQLLREEK